MDRTLPPKPDRIDIDPAAIKQVMKDARRWFNWQWELKDDWQKRDRKHYDKPPYRSSLAGEKIKASSTNKSTWTTFDKAFAAYQSGRFDGLGFALGFDEESGLHFSGVDLDECITDGKVAPWATYLVERLGSYTEYSPSMLGLKVFTFGPLPADVRKSEKDRCVEFYDGGRYFTVTGKHYPSSPEDIFDRTADLAEINAEVYPAMPKSRSRISDRDLALSALEAIRSRSVSYNDWLLVGMALCSVADDLLDAWDSWSRAVDKYAPGVCAQKWKTFGRQGVGIGSLLFWAKQEGWQDPRYSDEAPRPALVAPVTTGRFQELISDDDRHMGDGLTDDDGAGPWSMTIETGPPPKFLLRSPIWQNDPALKNGRLSLDEKDVMRWEFIRHQLFVQAPGAYAKPDRKRNPVWDGRTGPRLLRRLLAVASKVKSDVDYNRFLAAAEYILDCAARVKAVSLESETVKAKSLMRIDDGTVLFKVRDMARRAVKDAPGITFEDLREAATIYGGSSNPRIGGKRPRYRSFSPGQVAAIEAEINNRSQRRPTATEETPASSELLEEDVTDE